MKAGDFGWPGLESPETAAIWAADPLIGREQALEIALDAETAGFEFYKNILDTTGDPEIKVLAKEFVAEESGHVAELQKWIIAHKSGQPCQLIIEASSRRWFLRGSLSLTIMASVPYRKLRRRCSHA
jgi:hypothetical protein